MWRYLVLVVLVVACTPVMSGKKDDKGPKEARNAKNKQNKQDLKECIWEYGECMLEGGQTCGKGSKVATSTNENCPLKETSVKCKVACGDKTCRYKSVKNTNTSACNPTTNQKEISQILVSGDAEKCDKTKIVYKPCGKGEGRGGKSAKKNQKDSQKANQKDSQKANQKDSQKADRMDESENKPRGRKNKTTVAPDSVALIDPKVSAGEVVVDSKDAPAGKGKNGCKYVRKGPKEECDPVTKTRTITMSLKRKSPASCEPVKTVIKECSVKVARPNRKNPKTL